MDIVYPLKRGSDAYELRYSMRSLQNVPHDQVFVVGGQPGWLSSEVTHIQVENRAGKHQDLAANVLAACRDPRVSDQFILMNDDFFVMQSIPEIPVWNRGLSRDVEQSSELTNRSNPRYREAMIQTRERLEAQGYTDVLCFELHTPMVVRKDLMIEAYRPAEEIPRWHNRTAYGALAGLVGETVPDCKVYSQSVIPDLSRVFLSTSNVTFAHGVVGKHIRNRFTEPSPYES